MIVARHITPNGIIEFTDHAEYQAYLKANTPQPTQRQLAKAAVRQKRMAIKAFMNEVLLDFEDELLLDGLQNESKQVRQKMKQDTANLIASLTNGEIDLALEVINTFPAAAKDGKYITDQRLTDLKNSIIQFLNS